MRGMFSFRSVRPAPSEYNSFYDGYVQSVPDGDFVQTLSAQKQDLIDWISAFSEQEAAFRYAPGKWSIKEVFGHVIDTEWIFTYRALRFARGDQGPLPGMDQDQFMAGANFADRSIEDMVIEFAGLRSASIQLLGSFSKEILNRSGTASDNLVTVRALCWIVAGHCEHHFNILKERYVS